MNETCTKSSIRNRMIERSLVSTGNNRRMKAVIERARAGEQVTIAYIGGSITEGYHGGQDGNYAILSYQYFARTFGTGSNVHYVNAGMSGTPSKLALIRLERDVERHRPDIVFVEYAINDDSSDPVNRIAFESLVIRLLRSPEQPAVVLVFTISEDGGSAQNEMERVGAHYKLPMISVRDAIMPEIEAGTMDWSRDYAKDHFHPEPPGHALIAEMIEHYYAAVSGQESQREEPLPTTTVYGGDYSHMVMLDHTNLTPLALGGFRKDNTIPQLPKGWYHAEDAPEIGFVFELACKNLFIVTKESKDPMTGAIDVYVDGEWKLHVDGFKESGWNNPVTEIVFSDAAVRKRAVEIKMASGSENKSFELLAFGYSAVE